MATRKKKTETTNVVKGTHLTVTTDSNGKTTLEWDDEQLLKEVREAIASVEKKPKKKKVLNSVEEATEVIEKVKESSKKAVTTKKTAKKTTKGKTK